MIEMKEYSRIFDIPNAQYHENLCIHFVFIAHHHIVEQLRGAKNYMRPRQPRVLLR
jgi:hypothetical protein